MTTTCARTVLLVCVFGLLSASSGWAQSSWTATQQPNLSTLLRTVTALDPEPLGGTTRTTNYEDPIYVPNPDRRTYDIILIYAPGYAGPSRFVIMDTGSGAIKTIDVPWGLNFHLGPYVIAPNGKLYMSILERSNVQMCVYDPARNELKLRAFTMPPELRGETHPLTIGTDGMLYAFGAHPTGACMAARIDPNTGQVTPYGPIGPIQTAGTYAYSGAADDRYIYVSSGKVPWYLVAYDKVTGQSNVLIQTANSGGYISCGMYNRYGATAAASGMPGSDGLRHYYWLYQGRAIEKVSGDKPPWPQPAVVTPWVFLPPMPEVNMIQAMPDTRGNARFWYRTPAAKAMAPKPPPPGATPKQLGWRSFQYTVPTYATCVRRLAELPDGRIFGTSGNYLGNFVYEPATGIIKDLGRLGLSHYSTAVVGKYVYMSGYPNAGLYIYDTTKPWTANSILGDWTFLSESDPRSNPRLFGYMSTVCGAHKMYGAAVGADGRIYFGGAWMRDGNAGGFAWYDPATQTMGGFWDLFSNHQIDFVTATTGGRYIVISTHRVDDPILGKPKPPQGSLFVFDTMSHTIVRQIDPILLAKGPGPIVGVTGTRVLGWGPYPDSTGAAVSGKSILYGVDVATGQIAFQKVLPVSLPVPVGSNQDEAFDFRLGPDGYVWTFTGSTVLRIDPSNANVQPTALLPTAGRMGFAGEMVYLGGTLDLRRFPRGMGNDISLQ